MLELPEQHFTLSGDEDGGVGIQCRLCDLGGQPIAYYGWNNPYQRVPAVAYVREISALINAATAHLGTAHPTESHAP